MEPFYIIKSEIDSESLNRFLNYYINNLNWQQDRYVFKDKGVIPRRKTFMFGRNYNYSGQTKISVPYDELTMQIKEEVEDIVGLEDSLNGCLLNLYEDGDASISYHSDDENEMDLNYPIVVLSLGATRKFYFKNIETNEVIKLEISHGDILVMNPGCQSQYTHSIPKEKNVLEPRISLTFRKFI